MDTAECRRRAEHCREIADQTLEREHRDILLGIARTWEKLAENEIDQHVGRRAADGRVHDRDRDRRRWLHDRHGTANK
jgi:hypothetical protein